MAEIVLTPRVVPCPPRNRGEHFHFADRFEREMAFIRDLDERDRREAAGKAVSA